MLKRLLALLGAADACRFIAYCGNRTGDARKLLLDGENNLLALATSRPLLPALSLSRHYDAAQVPLRNVEKNLDGYGVSWYEEGESFPRRVRSANPIIKDNVSDTTFQNLLDGRAVPTGLLEARGPLLGAKQRERLEAKLMPIADGKGFRFP